ncbi:MAG TPA: type II toxin-antitoxin system VapC family toxin [Sulfurovum sp.]|nr:type II toxin-antitoxin system VapC family toxin [Sulfurovum sp.]
MNIIIDTHIFLLLVYDVKRVKKTHLAYLKDGGNRVYLSSISIAEMMIKKSLGNLEISFDIEEMLESMNIDILDFDGKSALILGLLPFHHKDPFDRMIISQSLVHQHKLISNDGKFEMYDCELL